MSIALVVSVAVMLSGCGISDSIRHAPSLHYATYHNQAYGFLIDYPCTWKKIKMRYDTGQGATWISPMNVPGYSNGFYGIPAYDAVFTAFSVVNAAMGTGVGQNFQQMLSEVKHMTSMERKKGEHVTYGVKGGWIWTQTIQKVGHGAISYRKYYFNLQMIEEFQLIFPTRQSRAIIPIWNRIETSFKIGNRPLG
ncbi:MAG: hypothetical protein ACYCYO_07130 [Bacilli bacterium]